ncbi:MAG: phosphate signaling complex protein PhoU [Candidatus Palauibacterales bacterium]|jgi:phosphate transport system protein|nr:phosphate signaling complex protein PhoU [Candidatus Palauibacterales bacterium]
MPHKHFDERLAGLEQRLLGMSHKVETMVDESVSMAMGKGERTIDEIYAADGEVDAEEVGVEEECIELFALHQPMASDLRLLVTVLKVNTDLERIGDHAVNIAEAAVRLRESNERPPRPPELDEMSRIARAMLRRALDALVHRSAEEADAVMKEDDRVDRLHESVFRIMLTHMLEGSLSACLQVILISRNIERIADLATNISEDVIFMVRGTTVRHGGPEAAESSA